LPHGMGARGIAIILRQIRHHGRKYIRREGRGGCVVGIYYLTHLTTPKISYFSRIVPTKTHVAQESYHAM